MAAPSYVFTIRRVAKILGEDEELLQEIAMGMSRKTAAFLSSISTTTHPPSPSPGSASTTSKSCSPIAGSSGRRQQPNSWPSHCDK
jgi:hypothetical protein